MSHRQHVQSKLLQGLAVIQQQRKTFHLLCASGLNIVFADKPDPATDLELTDQTERSVQLTWIPGDEHNSPTQRRNRLVR